MAKPFDIGNDLQLWMPMFSKSSQSLFQHLYNITTKSSVMLTMYPIKFRYQNREVSINDINIPCDKEIRSISLVRLDFLQEIIPIRAYRAAALLVHFMITQMCDIVIKLSSNPRQYHSDFVKLIKKNPKYFEKATIEVQRDVIDMCTSLKSMPFVLLVNTKIENRPAATPPPVIPGTFNAEEARKFLEERWCQAMADYIDGKQGIVMVK